MSWRFAYWCCPGHPPGTLPKETESQFWIPFPWVVSLYTFPFTFRRSSYPSLPFKLQWRCHFLMIAQISYLLLAWVSLPPGRDSDSRPCTRLWGRDSAASAEQWTQPDRCDWVTARLSHWVRRAGPAAAVSSLSDGSSSWAAVLRLSRAASGGRASGRAGYWRAWASGWAELQVEGELEPGLSH